MKIAQVCPQYYPHIGGVESHVREISERLSKKGFNVEVLTTDPKGTFPKEEVINHVNVKRFKSYAPNGNYCLSKGLRNYISTSLSDFDIVHAHNFHALPALYAAEAIPPESKFVFTPHYHGMTHSNFRNFLHTFYRRNAQLIFKKSNAIISVSQYERKKILDNFAIEQNKIIQIPNGVSEDVLSYSNSPRPGKTVLYVGRLEKYKGVDFIIRALPLVDKDIRLEIVGSGSYETELKRLSQTLKVNVDFSKNLQRSKLLEKYSQADLFLQLSKEEAFGISVGEALAMGVPCIVANCSALVEWVDNETCFGITYPIDIAKLAELIKVVMARKIRRRKVLTWNDVIDRLITVYDDLLTDQK